jgi:4-hydroxybenzoate polyprenyltransferase
VTEHHARSEHHAATGLADDVARSGRVRAFLRLVAIEHSVFALPFAYLAAVTAMSTLPCAPALPFGWQWRDRVSFGFVSGSCDSLGGIDWRVLALITVAMVAARTFAMAANRLIDRELDARNPRTASRELVTGAVSVRTARVGAGVALLAFLAAAAALGPLPLLLAPLAVVPLVVYPYGKRFTDYPHAILALAQAVAPVGAWIAVTGRWSWSAVVLGLAVGLWIGGFDLIYACQDTESDRAEGVRSLPARFGNAVALRVSSAVHAATFALFVLFGVLEDFGALWYLGLAATACSFVYQHRIVSPADLSRVDRAFFTSNGFVGVALGLAGMVDVVLR